MPATAEVFGKAGCPYTRRALEDLAARGVSVTYHDVTQDPAALRRLLELSGGERRVPLILERGRVAIGCEGS